MRQSLLHVALVVRDYDEAIAFYCGTLHFTLVEDTFQPEQDKRWVVVAPPGSAGTTLLLARASTPEQAEFVGNQAGDLRATLQETRDDELQHRDIGLQHGAEQAPGYRLLSAAIKRGCRLAIRISERI